MEDKAESVILNILKWLGKKAAALTGKSLKSVTKKGHENVKSYEVKNVRKFVKNTPMQGLMSFKPATKKNIST